MLNDSAGSAAGRVIENGSQSKNALRKNSETIETAKNYYDCINLDRQNSTGLAVSFGQMHQMRFARILRANEMAADFFFCSRIAYSHDAPKTHICNSVGQLRGVCVCVCA